MKNGRPIQLCYQTWGCLDGLQAAFQAVEISSCCEMFPDLSNQTVSIFFLLPEP